jgi:hypothetical protein
VEAREKRGNRKSWGGETEVGKIMFIVLQKRMKR